MQDQILPPETMAALLTVHNNHGMNDARQEVFGKIEEKIKKQIEDNEEHIELKQMLVLARPGEVVYGINPNSSSNNDVWHVVGMTIDEDGTFYRLEDENGHGWNLDTVKFLKYVSKTPKP